MEQGSSIAIYSIALGRMMYLISAEPTLRLYIRSSGKDVVAT
jgi:hypothetical protein